MDYSTGFSAKREELVEAESMQYTYAYENTAQGRLEEINVLDLTIQPKYDILNRPKGKTLCIDGEKLAEEQIVYRKHGDHATDMPSAVYFGAKTAGMYALNEHVKYAYDERGNIQKVFENGALVARYEYDTLNRLVREDDKKFGKTRLFTYDNNGNILSKRETEFTLKTDVEECTFTRIDYVYDGDRLISYNGQTFAYDAVGNPTTYRGNQTEWTMGKLTAYGNTTFTYDMQGRRLTKGDITFTYDGNGNLITQSDGLLFLYDHTGVAGVQYDGRIYLYRKDAQGNIIAILDDTGKVVVRYAYNAFGGQSVEVVDSDCADIAYKNPFRYRGYYYDAETGLYYLHARYYDPTTGRFISPDGIEYLDPESINGLNLYAYCGNNPVMYADPSGRSALLIGLLIFTGGMTLGGAIYGGVSAGKVGGDVGDIFVGIGKGALNGLILGGSISLAIGGFAIGGTTVLGSIMANYGLSVSANMLEVAITQGKKSYYDGDSFWAGANDLNNAMFANAGNILIGKTNLISIPFYGTRMTSKLPTIFNVLLNYRIDNIFGSTLFMASVKETLLGKASGLGLVSGYLLTFNQYAKLINTIFVRPDFENSGWILY